MVTHSPRVGHSMVVLVSWVWGWTSLANLDMSFREVNRNIGVFLLKLRIG